MSQAPQSTSKIKMRGVHWIGQLCTWEVSGGLCKCVFGNVVWDRHDRGAVNMRSEGRAIPSTTSSTGFSKHLSLKRKRSSWRKCFLGFIFICFFFFFFFFLFFYYFYFFFICGGFCHTLKWNSHGSTRVPHPNPPSHLPWRDKYALMLGRKCC